MWVPFYSVFYRWTQHCRKVNIAGRYAATTSPDFRCSTQELNNTLCLSRSAETRIQFSCCILRVVVVFVVVVVAAAAAAAAAAVAASTS
jgi:hypothetical protein